ncbi:MAG: hypothetical protein KatS3mg105_0790 [Gemmatales bacterium]|nr:MAG: hypothetical protein KatS3mg105_0790 [Gemmatales bacterium]
MTGRRQIVAVVMLALVAETAFAGIFFNRRPKSRPMSVNNLVQILKGDSNERRRAYAAEQIQSEDAQQNAELIPVLIDRALHDDSVNVRIEAVRALGRIRPISEQIGWALEQATRDRSWRVQWNARTALWSYRMNGYRRGSGQPSASPGGISTGEPPLAVPIEETSPAKNTGEEQSIAVPPPPPVPRSFGSRLMPKISRTPLTNAEPTRPLLTGRPESVAGPPNLQPIPNAEPPLAVEPPRATQGPALVPPR